MSLATQIIETTEVRQHNGQCAYGPWIPLAEAEPHVREAVSDEVAETWMRDVRHEPATENTDDAGRVEVGGEIWLYRR